MPIRVKTYIAYNMGSSPITVTFSDGQVISVPANSFNTGNGSGGGGGGTTAAAIPGKIEAESYTAMSGIDKETTTDTGGGQNVGWIDTGDWMDYLVNVQTAGSYTVKYRVAATAATGQIQLRSGSTTLATTAVPSTGGWQNWQTVEATVNLSAGQQTLRLYASGGGFNINWLEFTSSATGGGGGQIVTTDYTAGVTKNSASQATISFKPTTTALYVDVHYTVNGGPQQNLRMTNNNGTWTTVVNGLSAGNIIRYWFTYEKSGPQYDSPTYTYTH